jgi:membrane-associated phospholipid phosphatase
LTSFISQNRIFLGLYLLFLIIGAFIFLDLETGNEILYFNRLHSPFFDKFFTWVTRLAEGPVLLFILILALRFGYGKGLVAGLNTLVVFSAILVCKHLLFASYVRPAVFFEGREQLNFVQGVEIYRYNSFPSGHTATAFGLFFIFSILVKNKRWSYLFFMLALLVGVSRVYLLEHFFRDIYFGSMIGVFTTTLFYLTFVRSNFYDRITWKDKALLK